MSEPKPAAEKSTQKSYFAKWRGKALRADLPSPNTSQVLWSFLGGFLGILVVSYFAMGAQLFPLFAPFGASAVLLYGAPTAAFSQPRNLIGGHIFSATIGVVVLNIFGDHFVFIALAVALAIAVMLITKTVHPPAGATALLGVAASGGKFLWILAPVGAGAVVLLIVALVVNNLSPERTYPSYWY